MTDPRQQRGREGEERAARHLEELGYQILDRGWSCPLGELDLVARDGEYLVFVEVRLKSGPEYGDPLESLTPGKLGRIRKTALWYLTDHDLEDEPCRFDVVGVHRQPQGWMIELVKDAFE